jgi:hypothetical protein
MNFDKLTVVLPVSAERVDILETWLASLPSEAGLLLVDAGDGRAGDGRAGDGRAAAWLAQQERPGTTIIHHPGSLDAARDFGGRAAATPWLLFTTGQISFAPDYFERLSSQNKAEMVYGPSLSYEGGRWGWSPVSQRLLAWFNLPLVSTSNMLVSRHAFLALGGFKNHLSYHTFTAFAWQLRRKGYPIRFDPALVVHRHPRLQRYTPAQAFS